MATTGEVVVVTVKVTAAFETVPVFVAFDFVALEVVMVDFVTADFVWCVLVLW